MTETNPETLAILGDAIAKMKAILDHAESVPLGFSANGFDTARAIYEDHFASLMEECERAEAALVAAGVPVKRGEQA